MYAGLWRDSLYTAAVFFAPIGEAKIAENKTGAGWRWVALLVTPRRCSASVCMLHSGFKSGDYWLQNCVWHYGCFAFCGAVVSVMLVKRISQLRKRCWRLKLD